MRYQGTITEWNDEQGYGFITPDTGGGRIFVHIKAFARHSTRPGVGDVLTYELAKDQRGRIRAERVTVPGTRYSNGGPTPWSRHGGTLLALAVIAILIGATLLGRLPIFVPALYGVASLLAFAAYGKDKWAARNGRWRTAESTLLLLGIIGGWPGALAAQRVFRHKSSKRSFQIAFWLSVLLNSAALGLLLTPQAEELLHQRFIDAMWVR